MAREFPGWRHIGVAAKEYGVTWALLRKLVKEGVFTRGRFTSTTDAGPVYLKVAELDAWQSGGVDAVRAIREAVPAHDLGGES